MNKLSKLDTFNRGKTLLHKKGEARIPVFNLSKVRTTTSGKHVLDLNDAEGAEGKVGAIWVDGPRAGMLTQHERHAKRKMVKLRQSDYEIDMKAAKDAEEGGDHSAMDHFLRNAVPSLISFFDGEIHRLLEAYRQIGMGAPRPQSRKRRNPTLNDKLKCMREFARQKFGAHIREPTLRTWALRNIVIHPMATDIKDPFNYSHPRPRRLTADDVHRMTITDVEQDAIAIRQLLDDLWRTLGEGKKRGK